MKRYCQALLSVLAALSVPALWAHGVFSVQVDKPVVALGHPLTVQVRARDLGGSLDNLKLDALKRDFHIDSVSSNTIRQHRGAHLSVTRRLTLTVYPLRGGKLRIAPLHFRGHTSRPLTVTVRPAAPGGPRVHSRAWMTPAQPMVRQAATLHLTVRDDGTLQWNAVRLPTISGLYIRRLTATQRQETVGGIHQSVRRYTWELMPLQAGDWKISFPMLSAGSFGKPLKYPVPPVHFHADPAPAYLPVYVPVGKVSVHGQTPPARVTVGQPVHWTLTVTGKGLSRSDILKLLGPVPDSKAARFYPPRVARQAASSGHALVQTWRLTLPFRPLQAGALTLPTVSVPYFDPATGRLDAATVGGSHLQVIDPAARWWRLSLYVAALLVLGTLALHTLWRRYRRFRARQAVIARIREARNVNALRHALMGSGARAPDHPPLTLRQWLAAVGRPAPSHQSLTDLIQRLDAARFAPDGALNESGFAALKNEALESIRHLKTDGRRRPGP